MQKFKKLHKYIKARKRKRLLVSPFFFSQFVRSFHSQFIFLVFLYFSIEKKEKNFKEKIK